MMAVITVGYDAASLPLDYKTIHEAFKAAKAGDTLELWYSGPDKQTVWPLPDPKDWDGFDGTLTGALELRRTDDGRWEE